MSFGKKILEKYGYKTGDGLGKNSNGIVEPIKANYKFDHSGLGRVEDEKNADHWWERVFNEASSNIDVGESKSGIKLNTVDPDAVEITNKSFSLKKLKEKKSNVEYGNFLKSATLLANVEEEIQSTDKDCDISIINNHEAISDEQLFKICGGRTAHKSARHGLKLEGKLQRIAEQEKQLLEKMKNSRNKKDIFNSSHESSRSELETIDETDYSKPKSKSKRKREKQKELELISKISSMELKPEDENEPKNDEVLENNEKKKKKKRKRKYHNLDEDERLCSEPEDKQEDKKKHRKKRKQSEEKVESKRVKLDDSFGSTDHDDKFEAKLEEINSVTSSSTIKHKSKKKKSSRKKDKQKTKKVIEDLEKNLHF